jgi:AcrR family transcriptional regulator
MSAYKLASGLAAVPTAVLQNKLNKVVQRRADLPAKERRFLAVALRAVAKRFEQIADKIDIDEPPEMAYTRQAVEALRLAHKNKLAPIDPKEVIRAANAEITESDVEAARMVAQAWDFVANQLERLRSDRGPDAARG